MRIILAVLFVSLAFSAKADPIPVSPELKAFVTRPDQRQAVLARMGEQWRTVVDNCPSPKLQGMNILVIASPTFDSSGAPLSGEWRMIGGLEGCGETRLINVEYLFAPDGQMKMITLLPGTTAANVKLEQDALSYAVVGMAKLTPKDCKDIKFVDTKFIGYQGADTTADGGRHPWTEEWTVRSCGVAGIVTMHFAPDATGTAITTNVSETRPVNP